MNKEKVIKAGQIAKQVAEYAKKLIKANMPLLEIAEKIEARIIKLGGKPAFPVTISINEIAAHYTPSHDDKTKATGLLKVDLGVHIDGYISDTAFTIDLEDSKENKALISAAQDALNSAIKLIQKNPKATLGEIGKTIQQEIESKNLTPIINLSGHSMDEYELHTGVTIPNIDNKQTQVLEPGIYAIEPFATKGNSKVKNRKPSGIYNLTDTKKPRSPLARKILEHIKEEYQTLPFCSRWIVKKFGTQSNFALKQLEELGILHQYPQLVEVSGAKVSQAEHTILIENNKVEVTTN